mmetsp:Transcript_27277/g.60394  ORF Transcript_27277/g.60394 Transcript_27277/m.60394 type:complete len:234 (-) Transcript_27277:67-768(-)
MLETGFLLLQGHLSWVLDLRGVQGVGEAAQPVGEEVCVWLGGLSLDGADLLVREGLEAVAVLEHACALLLGPGFVEHSQFRVQLEGALEQLRLHVEHGPGHSCVSGYGHGAYRHPLGLCAVGGPEEYVVLGHAALGLCLVGARACVLLLCSGLGCHLGLPETLRGRGGRGGFGRGGREFGRGVGVREELGALQGSPAHSHPGEHLVGVDVVQCGDEGQEQAESEAGDHSRLRG